MRTEQRPIDDSSRYTPTVREKLQGGRRGEGYKWEKDSKNESRGNPQRKKKRR